MTTAGNLYLWGRGRDGQLGRGGELESIAAYRTTPQYVESLPEGSVLQVGHRFATFFLTPPSASFRFVLSSFASRKEHTERCFQLRLPCITSTGSSFSYNSCIHGSKVFALKFCLWRGDLVSGGVGFRSQRCASEER